MIYCFDLDLTLCDTLGNDYMNSKPRLDTIALVNRLHDEGNVIKIFTSRGAKSGRDWWLFTVDQLKEWGVKYSELIMTKPDTDYFIDDKNVSLATLQGADPALVQVFVQAYRDTKKILICGNGGLAAESSHFAAEMMGTYAFEVYLPCFALTTDTALITALANDIGFENVFSHQVQTIGQVGDIFVGMTTTQSKNVVKASGIAERLQLHTVMICGRKSDVGAEFIVRMDGKDVAEIQNSTIQFLHALAYNIKKELWESR